MASRSACARRCESFRSLQITMHDDVAPLHAAAGCLAQLDMARYVLDSRGSACVKEIVKEIDRNRGKGAHLARSASKAPMVARTSSSYSRTVCAKCWGHSGTLTCDVQGSGAHQKHGVMKWLTST